MVAQVLIILRILVGLLVIRTGIDLLMGKYIFSGFADQAPLLTGLFVILIGVHIIFASIFHR